MVNDMKSTQAKWENDLVMQIEERLTSLSNSFARVKRAYSEQLEKDYVALNSGLSDIRESIVEEKNQREDGTIAAVARVQRELAKIEEEILVEQKVREETSDKLRTLITEMESKLERDIMQESAEREATNTSLLTLLEEACSRIERTFNSDL